VLLNAPAILLRRKTKKDPLGRTSLRFKKALRHNVTVIGKSAFKSNEDDGPIDQEADEKQKNDPKATYMPSE